MAEVRAEMVASVWIVAVTEGDHVIAGETLVILESMKMEIPVVAARAGIVRLNVAQGDVVREDDVIAAID